MKKERDNNYGSLDEYDVENNENNQVHDVNQKIRSGFIKKVYGIVLFQLLITAAFCVASLYSKDISKFQKKNFEFFIAVVIVSIIILIVLSCFTQIARTVPINYILLLLFTLCEAYLVSRACAYVNDPKIVLMAAAMTCGIVFALTLYACVTDTDFTTLGGILFCFSIALLFFSIFAMFTHNRLVHIAISAISVLLFSVYLIYDTQLLLGRKQYGLSTEDYIIGAMMIYIDIIVIFQELMNLMRG